MPGVPNPPGTPNSPNLNPLTPATPPNTGTSGATGPAGNILTPQDLPLYDWQAALGTYLALIWLAEVPTLAPLAVSIAWGIGIIYAVSTNLPKRLAEAVTQGPSNVGQAVAPGQTPGTTAANNPNPDLGEIVGNAGMAQGIGR